MGYEQPNNPFTLLTLPLEIRVKIYHAYFVRRQIPVNLPQKPCWALVYEDDWPLLLTCKQIYAEALSEYFRMADFCCQRTNHAFEKMSRIEACKTNLRLVTIEPLVSFPTAQDLLHFPALETVRMFKLRAFEPLGFNTRRDPLYDPLSYPILHLAANQTHQIRWPEPQPVTQMKELEEEYLRLCSRVPDLHRPRLSFIINFDYSYNEKTDHPDGWGGMTTKRMVEVEYNQTNDTFLVASDVKDDQTHMISKTTEA